MSKRDDKFNWSAKQGCPHPITNNDLVCKDCIYKENATLKCRMFPDRKPGKVLYGEECGNYQVKD